MCTALLSSAATVSLTDLCLLFAQVEYVDRIFRLIDSDHSVRLHLHSAVSLGSVDPSLPAAPRWLASFSSWAVCAIVISWLTPSRPSFCALSLLSPTHHADLFPVRIRLSAQGAISREEAMEFGRIFVDDIAKVKQGADILFATVRACLRLPLRSFARARGRAGSGPSESDAL